MSSYTVIFLGRNASPALPAEVTVAYFMAFSCGTFLYFGATEVVVEEFSAGRTHWVKFGWFCIGIALMVCIKVFLE